MNVAIVGFATEGQATLRYLEAQGAKVTVCDIDPQKKVPEGVDHQLGASYLNDLNRFDKIFRTAGIHPHSILEKNPDVAGKITTTIDEFLRVCPTKNIIGVTGTKGKGTTSSLIAAMLKQAGKHVFLGGNIGLSPFEFLPQVTADSWIVLELSSFQLIDVKRSPHLAVCLMVMPEHLNWHTNLEEYIGAKQQLFRWQTTQDITIYYAENDYSKTIASISEGQKIPYMQAPGAYVSNGTVTIDGHDICYTDELMLLGRHNWQNACAAVTAVWQVAPDTAAIKATLMSFKGLEHRLEFVREFDGVKYYDDSFGTTPETAMVAVEAFEAPKVVILGGSDKGASFDDVARTVATSTMRAVIAIGEREPAITEALKKAGFTNIIPGGKTMPEIVAQARAVARPGDVVLLSTACASFDMFENYKDRGNKFKAAVNALV